MRRIAVVLCEVQMAELCTGSCSRIGFQVFTFYYNLCFQVNSCPQGKTRQVRVFNLKLRTEQTLVSCTPMDTHLRKRSPLAVIG